MTKERVALKLALEVFSQYARSDQTYEAITAIKEALAQPAEQEPVATVQCIHGVTIGYLDVMQPVGTKLYTSPPKRPWVGLTDDELFEIVRSEGKVTKADAWEIVKNLQAKFKEKNT
jgi:hypothetical protein